MSFFILINDLKKGSNKDRFDALFDFFSMSFVPGQELTKEKHVCHLENSIPDDKLLPTNGGPIHLPTSDRVLQRFYASEGKCALWVFPYHCIQFKNSLKGNAISEDQLNDSPDLSSGKGMINLNSERFDNVGSLISSLISGRVA